MDGPLPSIALQSPTWPVRYMNSLDMTAVDAGAGSFRGTAVGGFSSETSTAYN